MEYLNIIFTILIEILGWILIITNFKIDHIYQDNNMTNKTIQNCNKGILMLASAFILLPLIFWYAMLMGDCSKITHIGGIEMYAVFIALLGITLIVLGSLISTNAGNIQGIKNNSTMIWVLGLIMLFISLGYGGIQIWQWKKK